MKKHLVVLVLIRQCITTGDVGEWQPDGSLKIIDRKKNIFKLSQGEYVSVENLEGIYSLASTIDSVSSLLYHSILHDQIILMHVYRQIWIYGSSYESFLVAVVNPNLDSVERWAEENKVDGDVSAICKDTRAIDYILTELTKTGKENKVCL